MKPIQKNGKATEELELVIAIGLIWGHLNTRQFDSAYTLTRACLQLWPENPQLQLLASYATVESGHPLEVSIATLLNKAESKSWASRILQRTRKALSFGEKA